MAEQKIRLIQISNKLALARQAERSGGWLRYPSVSVLVSVHARDCARTLGVAPTQRLLLMLNFVDDVKQGRSAESLGVGPSAEFRAGPRDS
jgi:hypothetical protein